VKNQDEGAFDEGEIMECHWSFGCTIETSNKNINCDD
jgi:hypothetical protein